jgi:dTDP-glucose 4,6-dehydratase
MRNRYVLLCDALSFAVAAVGAFVLRFDFAFVHSRPEYIFFLGVALAIKLPVFYAAGLYHRYWGFANAADITRLLFAATLGTAGLGLALAVAVDTGTIPSFSRSVLVIDLLLTIAASVGVRLAIRLEQDSRSRAYVRPATGAHRILIVGAGNVGTMIVKLVEQNRGAPMRIVGLVDDDPSKHNKMIHGHRVLGPRSQLRRFVREAGADEVVIAIPTAPRQVVDEICAECDEIGVLKRVIPGIPDLLHGTLSVEHLREWRSVGPVATKIGDRTRPEQPFARVLVTGGAGFIGANFVRYWLATYPSSTVVVLDKLTYAGNPDNLAGLEEQYSHRYVFVHGDICDKDCVRRCVDGHGVEAVVNFAAESHVDRSLHFPDVFLQTNILGTHSLLDVVRHSPSVKHFHQVSTDEVYGQVLRGSFSEDDPLETRSPYSATKAGADMLVIAYAASFGVSATITRGSNNIGPYQYPEKAVPLFVTSAIDSEPLPVYGDGRYVRDYQYVLDHCTGIDVVMHRGVPGEIYNLGGGNEIEAIELARMIVRKLGRPESLIKLVADRVGQDRRYSLNCSKIKALGWTPQFSLERALDHTIAWYVENETWWRKIKSGEYRDYYDRQLRWRLEAALTDVLH